MKTICMLCLEEGKPGMKPPCAHDIAFAKAATTVIRHEYPPVYDSLLKAWVNNPPHGRPGQGAKE